MCFNSLQTHILFNHFFIILKRYRTHTYLISHWSFSLLKLITLAFQHYCKKKLDFLSQYMKILFWCHICHWTNNKMQGIILSKSTVISERLSYYISSDALLHGTTERQLQQNPAKVSLQNAHQNIRSSFIKLFAGFNFMSETKLPQHNAHL